MIKLIMNKLKNELIEFESKYIFLIQFILLEQFNQLAQFDLKKKQQKL